MDSTVSVAMIVRNEAAQLVGCLDCLSPLDSQICVVDTGSTDDTAAIARAHGALLEPFSWCNDFAAARNASLGLCTGEWILVVDADERFAAEDIVSLRALAGVAPDRWYRFVTRNYTTNRSIAEFTPGLPGDPMLKDYPGWFPSTKVRLFPNGQGICFEGCVHELPCQAPGHAALETVDTAIPVHHYPLDRPAAELAAKHRLYVALGQRKAEDNPEDPHAHAELAAQYAEAGEHAEAAASFRRALTLCPERADWLRDLGGLLHLMGRNEEAEKALMLAVAGDPAEALAWRNLGVIAAGREEWSRAAECFAHELEAAPHHAGGHCYLSVALERLGRIEDAAQHARRALELDPAHQEARGNFLTQMKALGRLGEAEALLDVTAKKGDCHP